MADEAVRQAMRQGQQKITYKFHKFRTMGRFPHEGLDEQGRPHREATRHLQIQHPRKGVFKGLRRLPHPLNLARSYAFDPDAIGHNRNQDAAKEARIWLSAKLAPFNFRLERTLGWGGNGIASLFSWDPGNGAARRYIVAKATITGDAAALAALRRERNTQNTYRGALHVVQTVDPKPEQERAWDEIILLEYFGRGSLHKLICEVQKNKTTFPNRVLWLVFQCLVQACIALEYPPDHDHTLNCPRDAQNRIVGLVSERIPPAFRAMYDHVLANGSWAYEGRAPGGTGLVHFDIDPQNILVGDPNLGPPHDNHAHLPVLQVGDFGLSRIIDRTDITARQMDGTVKIVQRAFLNDKDKMWKHRSMAKPDFLTPEQFTQEWDWVDSLPNQQDPRPKTAGKYCWKTNLYQFAVVMTILITLHAPPRPPYPEEIEIVDRQDFTKEIKVWTYGAFILNERFDRVDRKLRDLVVQCMCDEPQYRPELYELKTIIEDHLANAVWEGEDSDASVAEWVKQNIGDPPGPPAQAHWIDRPLERRSNS